MGSNALAHLDWHHHADLANLIGLVDLADLVGHRRTHYGRRLGRDATMTPIPVLPVRHLTLLPQPQNPLSPRLIR